MSLAKAASCCSQQLCLRLLPRRGVQAAWQTAFQGADPGTQTAESQPAAGALDGNLVAAEGHARQMQQRSCVLQACGSSHCSSMCSGARTPAQQDRGSGARGWACSMVGRAPDTPGMGRARPPVGGSSGAAQRTVRPLDAAASSNQHRPWPPQVQYARRAACQRCTVRGELGLVSLCKNARGRVKVKDESVKDESVKDEVKNARR